jgi:hypothetical protein
LGAWGESLASARKMVPSASGAVALSWSAVAGATGYNVYRNLDASGNGGATRLLAAEVTGTSYTDTGAAAPEVDGPAPLPLGSLTVWKAVSEEMGSPREGLDAVVATVPSGDAAIADSTYLFVVGGRPDASGAGYLTSGERAEVLSDGDLGPFAPLSNDLSTARAFYVLVTSQGQDESGFTPDPDIPLDKGAPRSIAEEPLYLLAIQGDDEHSGTSNDGLVDFEVCAIVDSDGDNGAWTTQDQTVPGGQPAHGLGAALYFDHMFAFKGVESEDLGYDPSVGGSAASRVVFYPDADDPAQILDDLQSDSTSFGTDRAYYELVRVNGYIWIIGGDDGTGPIASIERTLQ